MTTLNDALDFLEENGALKDWSRYQIIMLLHRAIKENTMAWSVDKNGNLNGIVIGKIVGENFHIVTIVLKSKGLFKIFLKKFYEFYPTLKITGYRRGKVKDFTKKLSLLKLS